MEDSQNSSNIQFVPKDFESMMTYFNDTHTSNIPFMVFQQKRIIALQKQVDELLAAK